MEDKKKQFAKIYDQNIEKIYRFLFLKLGSREAAEDLTAEVFAKGWDKFRNSKNLQNPVAYLYQIARTKLADYYRDKGKFKVVLTEENQIPDADPNPEENQILESEIEMLRVCLAKLSDDYQNIIIWRYLDGLSIQEIAEIMGKEEGTIRVMIHRALKEMKEKMADLGV